MSEEGRYFLAYVRGVFGDYSFTEHYVLKAASQYEAEMRVAHGLKTWYDEDGTEPDEYGIHKHDDPFSSPRLISYSGSVMREVSWHFVDECPPKMKAFRLGDDWKPNLKDIAKKVIKDKSIKDRDGTFDEFFREQAIQEASSES